MSTKSWKRARRRLRSYQQEIDADKRARCRIPWTVRLFAFLVVPPARERWLQRWETEHRRKLKKAVKTGARLARRLER